MTKKLFIATFTLFHFVACGQMEGRIFEWSQDRKLNWADFKGPKQNRDVAASTYCGITIEPIKTNYFTGKSIYRFAAIFNQDSSFFLIADTSVLKHEQLHFDIAELYARKIRQALQDQKSLKEDYVLAIFYRLNKEYTEFQNQYESETSNGQFLEEQKSWQILVQTELSKLDKFIQEQSFR